MATSDVRLGEGLGPVFVAFPLSVCPISIAIFRPVIELELLEL
jgi:hypothetical protein